MTSQRLAEAHVATERVRWALHERQRDRAGVGQHVRGVRQQCEGVHDEADNDLDGREADDERERDGQLAAAGVGGEAVSVPGVTPPSAWACPWA